MKTLLAITALLISGCVTTPDFANNGEGCWRFGVLENGNTGRMSPTSLDDIKVVKLNYDELLDACGIVGERLAWHNKNDLQIRACYDPMTDTIYEYTLNFGEYFTDHEKCHIILGRQHNACGTAYGIGKDESACNWKEL
jgi:hypothetical protein